MVCLKAPSRPRIVACARFKSGRSGGWGRRTRRGEKKVGFFFVLLRRVVWLRWPLLTLDSRWANAPGGRRGGVAPMAASASAAVGRGPWQRTAPDLAHVLCLAPDATGESIGHSFRERSLRPEVTRRAAEGKKTRRGAARRCGILEKVILVVFPPPIRAGVQLQLVGTRHHVAVLLSAWERVALPTFLASLWAGRWSRSRRYGKGKKEAAVRPAVGCSVGPLVHG